MTPEKKPNIHIRQARRGDGGGMWEVVKASEVLDLNSSYLYLIQAEDFSETCAVAEMDGRIVGLATGYRQPRRPQSVFLWQIGIRPEVQGRGLGKRLVFEFLRLPGAAGATRLETTVTPSNEASRALFNAVARDLNTECRVRAHFTGDHFPDPGHEDEDLFEVGPFDRARLADL